MGKKRQKPQQPAPVRRATIEEVYGVIGGQLRREHVGDLVYDLGILIEEARAGREDRIQVALESIAETLGNVSDKFERRLFIPAITAQRQRTIEFNAKHQAQAMKNERRWRTETLEEFTDRGGKVTKLTSQGGKITGISLEDLGL